MMVSLVNISVEILPSLHSHLLTVVVARERYFVKEFEERCRADAERE